MDLAVDARERRLPLQFTVIGHTAVDENTMKMLDIVQTGRYRSDAEALDVLVRLDPDFVLFPSISPETHCYALSLALLAGIPPVVFDLGAPAERLRDLGVGAILNPGLLRNPSALNQELLELSIHDLWMNSAKRKAPRYGDLIRDYYDTAEISENLIGISRWASRPVIAVSGQGG
jgi:O-antigen biosynthesis protein